MVADLGSKEQPRVAKKILRGYAGPFNSGSRLLRSPSDHRVLVKREFDSLRHLDDSKKWSTCSSRKAGSVEVARDLLRTLFDRDRSPWACGSCALRVCGGPSVSPVPNKPGGHHDIVG